MYFSNTLKSRNSLMDSKLSSLDKTKILAKQENLQLFAQTKNNKTRTNLLLIVDQELSLLKKKCSTKINHKFIQEAEKEFSAQNTHHLEIKEMFSPRFMPNKGQVFQQKFGNQIISNKSDTRSELTGNSLNCNSPKRECDISPLNFSFGLPEEKLNLCSFTTVTRKTSLSTKKIEFFRVSTLKQFRNEKERRGTIYSGCTESTQSEINQCDKYNKKDQLKDKNIDCITSVGSFNNNSKITQINGFKYLSNLAKKYKIIKKQRSSIQSYMEVIKESLISRDNTKFQEKEFELKLNNDKADDLFYEEIERKFMEELKSSTNIICKNNLIKSTEQKLKLQSLSILDKYCKNSRNSSSKELLHYNQNNKKQTLPSYQINGKEYCQQLSYSCNPSESNDFFIKLVACSGSRFGKLNKTITNKQIY